MRALQVADFFARRGWQGQRLMWGCNMAKTFTFKGVRFSPEFIGRSRAVVLDTGFGCQVVTVSGCPSWWLETTTGIWYVGDVTVSGGARRHVSDVSKISNMEG